MAGGFFGKLGKKVIGSILGEADGVAKKTPDGAKAPEPQQPVQPTPESGGGPDLADTPLDTNPATGAPPRGPDDVVTEEAIDQLGAPEYMEPPHTNLEGRMEPHRNINLSFFRDDSTKKTIEFYNRAHEGFVDNPKREVVTHRETLSRSAAGAINADEYRQRIKKVVGGDVNEKWEPEDLVTIYQLMEDQASELREYAMQLKAQRAGGIEPSHEDLAHYQLLEARFVTTQEIASVRAAEAGRMLNALQAVSKSGGRQYYQDLSNIVRGAGGPENIFAKIDIMSETEGLKDAADKARKSFAARTWDNLVQLRYSMMLSSWRTHAANVAGSAMTGLYEKLLVNPVKLAANNAEYVVRAAAQKMFGKGGMRAEDRMRLAEVGTEAWETVRSLRQSFALSKQVFKGEKLGHGKFYNEMGLRMNEQERGAIMQGVATPTRLLEAEDAFFRSTYYNSKIAGLAKRKALNEAKTNEQVAELYQNYIKSPTDDMVAEARDHAAKLTFTNDPSYYGSMLHSLSQMATKVQEWEPVGRLVLPFVRTPANIVGYTLENTPMRALTAPKKLLGQLTSKDATVRADAEARMAIAAGLYVYLKDYWSEGKITGAPPDNYGVLRAREQAGWKANAIRVGDDYYELNRMDPLGMVLAMYATSYDAGAHLTEEDIPTSSAASIITVATMLTDRSFLAGLGDVERIFQSSEGTVGKQAGKFAGRTITSFYIPGVMRDAREMQDPYKRSLDVPDTLLGATWETVKKATLNAVPWMTDNLPPQVDAHGEDKINGGGMLWRGLVPIRTSHIEQDPVSVAYIVTGTPVNKPDYRLSIPGGGGGPKLDLLAMDDGQGWVYRHYQKMVGRERKAAMEKVIKTSVWKKAVENNDFGPESLAADAVMKAVRMGKQAGTIKFLEQLMNQSSFRPKVGGEQMKEVKIIHAFDKNEYKQLVKALKRKGPTEENLKKIEDTKIYKYKYKPEQKGLPPEMRTPEF